MHEGPVRTCESLSDRREKRREEHTILSNEMFMYEGSRTRRVVQVVPHTVATDH